MEDYRRGLKMKIFVGTMHSEEAEYEESKKCVFNQQGVEIFHFIVDKLPEYEAHNALWNAWNDAKKSYDIFIKVDADTIIEDPNKFHAIAQEFEKNERLTGMQIPLHDYFMNGPVLGLNCFSNKVVFTPAKSRLHADHADSGHDIVYRNEAVAHLAPAGKHCAYPSDRQAFHYGLHRMKKNQRETIIKVYRAWKELGGNARLIALYGARAAVTNPSVDHDYNAGGFGQVYSNIMSEGLFDNKQLNDLESFMRMLGA
jgi:hypothetical protein